MTGTFQSDTGGTSIPLLSIMVEFTTGFGTAPPATGGSEAGPRGEEGFYQHFGTAPPATGGSEVFPRAEASPNQPQPVSILYPCRSSARGPLLQVPQGHPGVAMGAPGPVLVHEMGLSHGRRAPGPVFVHEMGLYHDTELRIGCLSMK